MTSPTRSSTDVSGMQPSPDRPRIAVVGAGHWLVAEDRIGLQVLELLRDRYGSDVELCEVGTAPLALLDHLGGQDLMLIVDACAGGDRPGEVIETEPDLDMAGGSTSAHQLGPLDALVVAKHLFPEQIPRRLRLVLVHTDGLDEETEFRACQEVIAVVDREVAQALAGPLSARTLRRDGDDYGLGQSIK